MFSQWCGARVMVVDWWPLRTVKFFNSSILQFFNSSILWNDSAVVAIAATRSRILRRLRCSRRFTAIRIYIAVTLRDVVFLFLDDIAVLVHLLPWNRVGKQQWILRRDAGQAQGRSLSSLRCQNPQEGPLLLAMRWEVISQTENWQSKSANYKPYFCLAPTILVSKAPHISKLDNPC